MNNGGGYSSALLQRGNLLEEQPWKLRRDFRDQNTSFSQTLHLSICRSLRSGNDCPSVTHSLPWRRGPAGDVCCDPLRIFRITYVGSAVLFSGTPNLTYQNDLARPGIFSDAF